MQLGIVVTEKTSLCLVTAVLPPRLLLGLFCMRSQQEQSTCELESSCPGSPTIWGLWWALPALLLPSSQMEAPEPGQS